MNYVIIFFVMVFSLSIGFMEAERNDWDAYFKEEIRVQDSLWQVIQAIELEKGYFKK